MRSSNECVRDLLPLTRAGRLLGWGLWLVLGLSGCVHRYTEPAPSEPHALVKFRFLHHQMFRSSLDEILRLDGYDIAIPPGAPTEPRLRTVRVRPSAVPTEYRFAVDYYHTVTTTRMETRTESYSCGTGTQPRTCTRTVTQPVTQTQHVTDAACEARLAHTPLVGAIYLVQFDFYGHDACSASCFRQLDGAGDAFTLVPCGPGEPPGYASTAGDEIPAAPSSYGRSLAAPR